MTGQVALTARPLTERQQHAWQLIHQTPGGVTAEQVGAHLHALKGKHPADEPCQWCQQEGRSVLTSKALAPLVVRRRASGRYEPRDPADRTGIEGPMPTDEIPF